MPSRTAASTPLSVLLVEDSPGDAYLLTESLRGVPGSSLAVHHVGTLTAAIERQDEVDVVLLDLGLPESTGLATLETLRSAGCGTPVVVLTSHDDDVTAQLALQAGAQDYVVKGTVDGHVMARVIRHATERHALQRALESHALQRSHLGDLARSALEGTAWSDLAHRAATALTAVLDTDLTLVLELRENALVVRGHSGWRQPPELGGHLAGPVDGLVGRVLATNLPVVVDDLSQYPEAIDPWLEPEGVAAVAAVPMPSAGGSAAGVVLALTRAPRVFQGAELAYLSDLAVALSEAMRRQATEQDRRERAKELATLYEVQRTLQTDLPLPDQLEAVVDHVAQGMQFPDDVRVAIVVEGTEVAPDCRGCPESVRIDIGHAPAVWGHIEVAYTARHGFLPEERRMLESVAEAVEVHLGRRRATQAAHASERWLRSLVSSIPGIVFTTDADLRFVAIEGGAIGDLGPLLDDLIGLDIPTAMSQDPAGPDALAACRRAMEGRTGHFRVSWSDRTWHVALEPMHGSAGEVDGVVGLALDVTEAEAAAAALDESRRRLQGLFDNANDAMLLIAADGRYVDANPAAQTLVGYPRDELLAMHLGDLGSWEGQLDLDAVGERLRIDGSLQCELAVRRQDGTTVTVDCHVVADIVPGLHLVVARDVTQQRAARDALQRSEERFRALVQQATDAIMITDESLRATYVSPAMSRIVGRPVEELLGTSSFDFVHPGDVDLVGTALASVLGQETPSDPVRVRVRHRDGSSRLVEAVTTDLRDDPAVGGIVVNVRDVTEQVAAVDALAESEARFRRIAEHAHDVIFRVRLRPEPAFDYVSPAVEGVSGYRADELYARPELLYGIAHPEDRERLLAIREDPGLLEGPIVLRWLRRDGTPVWIELRAAVVDDADGLVVEGVARDITERELTEQALVQALEQERQAAEELRRVGQMKHTFLQAVSHEMRTPLTSIIGFAELLEEHGDDLPQAARTQVLGRLAANAGRLHVLLGDLLDLDRMTRDIVEVRRQQVRLDRLVTGVLSEARTEGRQVTVDIAPLEVDVDAARVERIVENLLGNAVRHTPVGSSILVTVDEHPEGVVLRVDDSGHGVPDEQRAAVFEPFAQGDTPAARTGGAGIGLSVVARFAELHGGRAWVADREGGGASFRVLLPCSPRRVAEGAGASDPPGEQP